MLSMAEASKETVRRMMTHEWWQSNAMRKPALADFQCSITGRIMEDPVTAEDKFNYEFHEIQKWLKSNTTSPQNGKPMGKMLVRNSKLKKAIEKFNMLQDEEQRTSDSQISWPAHGEQDPKATRSVTIESCATAAGEESKGPPAKRARRECDNSLNMSAVMSKFFRELDPLRDLMCSVLDGWTPPKIVVIGDESAGKSTLLEQLAMLPVFPRKRRFCTKMAIHVRLRRASTSSAALAVHSVGGPGQEEVLGAEKMMPQENGWFWVQEEMERLVKEHALESTKIVTDKILVLTVKRPDVASIDLVDMPGVATVPKEKAEQIQAILQRQLQDDVRSGNHAFYLAVVPASGTVRPNTNMAMKFVQDNGLQDKTFGVFTKCDHTADPDVLCALVTGEATGHDGETLEALGAVSLAKGWTATMLKPPAGKEFSTHNFERILIQQGRDADFFAEEKMYEPMVRQGKAGIKGAVRHIEQEYTLYLQTTWKISTMTKVLLKLEDRELEMSLLGVVTDQSQRDKLARLEVERRLGPDSPVKELHHSFHKQVLQGKLCAGVRGELDNLTPWDGCDTHEKLEALRGQVGKVVSGAVQDIELFWMPKLRDLLLAKSTCKMDAAGANIVTESRDGMLKQVYRRIVGKKNPKQAMQRALKEQPLIQLSNYPEFTEAILARGKLLLDSVQKSLLEETQKLVQRLVDPDSPYLELQPMLAYPKAAAGAPTGSEVKPVCDVQKFLNALVALFLREVPSPNKLRKLHEDVEVGKEQDAAKKSYEDLSEEIRRIEAARDGIRRALSIGDEEFRGIQLSLEEEHTGSPAGQ